MVSQREKLLAKLAKEKLQQLETFEPPNVLEECLPYQLDFIKDSHKRKVICSTRRSAKTYALILALIDTAIRKENGILCFITLTRESAKRIFRPILRQISTKYNLNLQINSNMEIEFPNHSIIYLIGLDATEKQMERVRGNKYNLVAIDEAQGFTQDLREIINDVLDIALAQSQASLLVAGTPGDQQGDNYFYQIARPGSTETEWKQFFFDWRKNTSIDQDSGLKVCDAIQQMLDEKIKARPEIVETDSFQQEWLGQWVILKDARVYHSEKSNYITTLPAKFLNEGVSYLLGIDMGWHDATAFVIAAYNPFISNKLYILRSEKLPKLTITDVANKIKDYQKVYNFSNMVIDAGGGILQGVEEMRQVHNLPLIAAEKLGKDAHIALLNADFITKDIFILKHTNEALIKELNTLIWDQKLLAKGQHKEDPRFDNHLCFIAGTKVQTINGPKNIEDIKVGDLILTRKGYLPAIWSGETGTEEIYHLQTKYGRELFATKTHPIFIENKLTPLKEVKSGDILTCIEERPCQTKMANQKQLFTKAQNTEDILTQKLDHTEFIGQVSMKMEIGDIYIEPSMKIISEKYQMDITSIISMKIRSIMNYLISNLSLLRNIKVCILQKDGWIQNIETKICLIWEKLENLLKNGMPLQKVWNGINNMVLIVGKIKKQISNIFVSFAKNNLKLEPQMLMSVPMPVSQDNVGSLGLMMNSELVQPVINSSDAINILNKNIVADYVSTVKTTGQKAKVYNLTVQDQHEYFANGILVSNTDAMLYTHHMSRHWWYQEKAPDMSPQEAQTKRIMDVYASREDDTALEKAFWEKGFNNDFHRQY